MGDHIVLVALADALGKTIRVVSSLDTDNFEIVVEAGGLQGAPLLLGHLSENHYVSLEPVNNSNQQCARSRPQCGQKLNFVPSADADYRNADQNPDNPGDVQGVNRSADQTPDNPGDVQGVNRSADQTPDNPGDVQGVDRSADQTPDNPGDVQGVDRSADQNPDNPEDVQESDSTSGEDSSSTGEATVRSKCEDEVVNYFMAYLEESFTRNVKGCQRVIVLDSFFWTKLEQSIKNGQEISAIRQSKGVDLRKKKIIYFDPTGDGLSDCSDFSLNIRLFLKCRLQDQSVMDHNVWKDVNVDHAVQTDEKSCGIFMLKMAECLAREVQPEFTQRDAYELRVYIGHVIIHTEECITLIRQYV
ncbi:hypothetical protein OS493_032507 [Desmophyllum pertusum]|uniref:Ubiquitin-like protease family profile domain-containing protein n=1 Tax=Desmophyllum pertusum TaxID=174260 RepID=A0A9W9Z7R1_9CNID|nr:hypothetical protein OS493_032507 [Desmophyllum pertusum]